MSDDELAVLAVLADPDGERFIEAPATHEAMNRLQREVKGRGELFYCATALGGCGEEVTAVNGDVRRPHFRHYPGRICPLTPAVARDAYTHLAIQNALVAWLHELGNLDAKREQRVGPHSRVDVHCHPDAVIEVQLSPEIDLSMQERNERYGGNVTWLFDPDKPITSRDSILTRDDIVLVVQLRPTHDDPAPTGQRPIDVGIRTVNVGDIPGITDWSPLKDCTFTPLDGLQHPGRDAAEKFIATAREEQRAAVEAVQRTAAQAEANEAAEREERRRRAVERYRQESARVSAQRQSSSLEQDFASPSATNGPPVRPGSYPIIWSLNDLADWQDRHGLPVSRGGAWWRVLAYYHDEFPGWAHSISDRWAAGLPEHLIDPAWATLFLMASSLSGQPDVFVDHKVDPEGLILQRLEALGLINFYGEAPDPLMVRVEQLVRPVGRDSSIREPPAWNAY
jgi:hypothetical protein